MVLHLQSRIYGRVLFSSTVAFIVGLGLTASAASTTPAKPSGSTVYVNPDGQPVMQFNTDRGASAAPESSQGAFKFKTPGDNSAVPTSDKTANPIDTANGGAAFKTYVGYPKQFLNLNYAPSSFGGKYSYQGFDYNYSSTDVTGLNLNYKLITTPNFFFEVDASYITAKAKAGSAGNSINDSSANTVPLMFRGNYCWIGDNFFSKFCPGLELGLDSYPVLGFTGNTTLELQKASEFVYGVNIYGQAPLIRSTTINGRLGYINGSGSGQSGNLTSKKNNLIYLDAKIEWPVAQKRYMNVGLLYSSRTATIGGKVSSALTDQWDTKATLLMLKLGYTWEFSE